MAREIIQPKSVHSTTGVGYSHVAKAGNTVYIAGQIALDGEGNLVGKGDIEAQTHRAYANLQAILKELGGSLDDIVKMTLPVHDRRAGSAVNLDVQIRVNDSLESAGRRVTLFTRLIEEYSVANLAE